MYRTKTIECVQIRKVYASCRQTVTMTVVVPALCPLFACNGFIEDPTNPVYNPYPASIAYYETVRYDPAEFAPFGSSAYYKMWYDRASSGGIALALSADGLVWTFNANLTGLLSTARHSRVLFDRNGFGLTPTSYPYRIWYWDSAGLYNTSSTTLDWLYTAYSLDGVTWVGDTNMLQDPAFPLLFGPPGTPFAGSYGPADILYFPENPPVLDLANPFNNRYVLYYDVTDGAKEELALAVSVDGVTWAKAGPSIVLPYGGDGAWDANYACEGAVVLQLAPDQFYLLYSGGINSSHEGIGCASSSDGLTWTKYSGNPIFSIFDGVAWRDSRTYNPWVLVDPNRFSGHGDSVCFKLWLTGAPLTNSADIAIGYGTQ